MSATTTLSSPDAILFDAFGTLFDVRAVLPRRSRCFPVTGNGCRSCGDASKSNTRNCARSPIRPAPAIARSGTSRSTRCGSPRAGSARAEQRGREAADGRIRVPVDLSRYGARAAQAARARPAPAARDPVERHAADARHRDQERRHVRAVRSRAVGRHRARVQAGFRPPTRSAPTRSDRTGAASCSCRRTRGTSPAPSGSATRRSGSTARARPPRNSARRPTAPAPAWPTCSHSSPPRLRPADPQTARAPARVHDVRSAAAFPFTETATDRPRR